jgi:hypothetical protein
MMRSLKYSILLTMSLIAVLQAGIVYGQAKQPKFLKGFEIGFYLKQEIGFGTCKPVSLKSPNPYLYIRIPLTNRFKAEVSINRSQFYNGLTNNQGDAASKKFNLSAAITAPVSLQYYFGNPNQRIRPFIGIGGTFYSTLAGTGSPINGWHEVTSTYRGPNYISVFFTQGMTIEINTHLQITQALHFYNGGDNKNVEMNVGIGYRLP